jgi:plastocyanin
MKGWFARCSVGLLTLASLVGGAGMTRADTFMVDADSNFFSPFAVTIATGDTVTWTINGVHTVTSGGNGIMDGLFDSGVLSGGTFSYTFTQAGDYPYFCTLHFDCCDMEGIVHVVDPVKLRTPLFAADPDDPNAFGDGAFQMRPNRAGFLVNVTGVTSTAGVDVFVNGNFVGSIALDATGAGELFLDTELGDTVPPLQAGDVIAVYDMVDDTTLILFGTLGTK